MSIQIDSIQKTFGGAPVLKDISLTIETGEMAALLGLREDDAPQNHCRT